ncbi:MAG TPA: hypothetical protein VEZ11_01475 [Thermoanaerobaculia bacterium]|nr:hypothetical protein [Thermoanaerobaculia bacterium]
MSARTLRQILVVAIIVVSAMFVAKQLAGSALSMVRIEPVLIVIGSLAKLLTLLLAAIVSARVAGAFGRGDITRRAWLLLAGGLGALTCGQAVLSYYQVVQRIPSPFPSWADVAFVLGYPLLILALLAFLRAFSASGFPTDGQSGTAVMLILTAMILGALVISPIVTSPGAPLQKTLNVVYPILDLILAIPAVLLLRSSLRFRGGMVWKVWAALMVGILFTAAGDILFAWFNVLGQTHLDAAIDAVYILGNGCLAIGALYQSELLES